MFCFNQHGDVERALLRKGNVHRADDWRSVLDPVVARYRDKAIRTFFRGDAAFAKLGIYEFLEEDAYQSAIRLPANEVLCRQIEDLTFPPTSCPVTEPFLPVRQRLLSGAELG